MTSLKLGVLNSGTNFNSFDLKKFPEYRVVGFIVCPNFHTSPSFKKTSPTGSLRRVNPVSDLRFCDIRSFLIPFRTYGKEAAVEVAGGLYHVIARGNDRQDIFHSHEDRLRFLSLLAKQKARSPFFIYAFCLMTNHIHILLERQADTVGSIMQRVLGGYSRYYNRKYKHVGPLFCMFR